MTTQEEFFGGKGYPAVKFENIGDACRGTVVKAELVPRKSLNPPYELEDNLAIVLDPSGAGNEDEFRTLWVRRSKLSSAIRDAYQAVGAARLEPGGVLAVKFESTEAPKTVGHSPAKVYRAKYTAPAASTVSAGDVFDDL